MNVADGTEHYTVKENTDDVPSLLVLVLDTNPYAWESLSTQLPLQSAISAILIFINAHLALSHANCAAVIASHTHEAVFLMPTHPHNAKIARPQPTQHVDEKTTEANFSTLFDSDKYRAFRQLENEVTLNLRRLIASSTASSTLLNRTTMAGALSLALAYINKQSTSDLPTSLLSAGDGIVSVSAKSAVSRLNARILVLSVSADLAVQYIPIMNCIFAAQRRKIPIDVCKIAGDTVFLQQASDATRGIYMELSDPKGLLQYLMMGFLADADSRMHLLLPTQVNVDFRAACFCHKEVSEFGYVCSICLSIFCIPPERGLCTTCGTKLSLTELSMFGKETIVLSSRKKKKKRKAGDISTVITPTAS